MPCWGLGMAYGTEEEDSGAWVCEVKFWKDGLEWVRW